MRERDLSRQVEEYVSLVNSLKILEKVPGRQWYRDMEFAHNLYVKEPENFIKTLKIFCDKDVARQMNERETESEVLEWIAEKGKMLVIGVWFSWQNELKLNM